MSLILADKGQTSTITSTYKSVSNKYVDITFSTGVYADLTRVNPVTASNFSITNFSAGGTTAIAIASVKRNTHYTSASALDLIGGEKVIRVFLTLTGTPDSTETFTVQCTNVYSGQRVKSSPVTGTIKLNITPLMLYDFLETAAVTRLSLGVSQMTDVMGVANAVQGTDANRPVDGGDAIGFNPISPNTTKWLDAGDVGALDFQKGNNFTIVIKRLSILSAATTGFVISNRINSASSAGWSIQVSSDGSLIFNLSDGTLQGACDYDAFSGTGEATLFFENNNGTLNIRNAAGTALGTTGDATGIGTISYTNAKIFIGRREFSATAFMHGYFEKIAIINSLVTSDQRTDFNDNL